MGAFATLLLSSANLTDVKVLTVFMDNYKHYFSLVSDFTGECNITSFQVRILLFKKGLIITTKTGCTGNIALGKSKILIG